MQNVYACLKQYGYTGSYRDVTAIVGTSMEGTLRWMVDALHGQMSGEELTKAYYIYESEHPLNYREAMFPEIPEVLKMLHEAELKLACCSSSPRVTVVDSIQEMGIASYFDVVLADEDVSKHKPDPMVYLKAMECLRVKPEECIVYEDSEMGIAAGKASGAYVVARLDERFHQNQTAADAFVHSAKELAEMILEGSTCRK